MFSDVINWEKKVGTSIESPKALPKRNHFRGFYFLFFPVSKKKNMQVAQIVF